jgi:uncharacterized protein involved in exopolysaccharide biosynthesis
MTQVTKLQERLKKAEASVAEARGNYKAHLTRLKAEHGVDSLEAALEKRDELAAQVEKREALFAKKLKQFEETYRDLPE